MADISSPYWTDVIAYIKPAVGKHDHLDLACSKHMIQEMIGTSLATELV